MPGLIDQRVRDAVAIRSAGADLLGLALLDARNTTLAWLGAFDGVEALDIAVGIESPAWLAGHAAWFQESWIARHPQRPRGPHAAARASRLPPLDPRADAWFDADAAASGQRLPVLADEARDYMAATLERTLDLLAACGDADADALHFFRLALHHEDRIGERLAELAQAVQLETARWPQGVGMLPVRVRRDPIGIAAQRVRLGHCTPAWRPAIEDGECIETIPEFEIDAQVVCWGQWQEFVEDGGYDSCEWWGDDGWPWRERSARRAPRYVEQQAGGITARRGGRLQKLPAAQAVVHASWFEARAWCRWAGRRLPAEAEWVAAQRAAGPRGFAWGDVVEWVADRASIWPGRRPAPGEEDDEPRSGQRVLRGACFASAARLKHPAARRFDAPDADRGFYGFRSCAL